MIRKMILSLLVIKCSVYCLSSEYEVAFYAYFKENVLSCDGFKKKMQFEGVGKLVQTSVGELPVDSIMDVVFLGINSPKCFIANKGIRLNDDKIVGFLVNAVFNTRLSKKHRRGAADVLRNRCSYESLPKYKKRFLSALDDFYSIGFDESYELLALLDLNKEEEIAIFGKKNLKIEVKARLGDTAAVAELIERYENGRDYNSKESAVRKLLYSGNLDAIKYCIQKFNDPVIQTVGNDKQPCKEESIRYPIIDALSYYFPDNPLLNEEFKKAVKPYGVDNEYIKDYLKRFVGWAEKQYGVKPVDPEPEPFLRGLCKR